MYAAIGICIGLLTILVVWDLIRRYRGREIEVATAIEAPTPDSQPEDAYLSH